MAATANPYHQSLQHNNQNGILENNLNGHSGLEQSTDFPTPLGFCIALYDYDSRDPASLPFRRGDVITVMNQLESGWWDGYLHEERGWFPSNYVAFMTDQELLEHELRNHRLDASGSEERHDLRREMSGPSSDFWVPQVAPDGRIFYVNTQTGDTSNELPTDADCYVEPLVNGNTSAVTLAASTSYSVASSATTLVEPESVTAGFGLPGRSSTPEPWVKRLTDDGMSYYYLNTVDNTTRWTPPSPIDLHSQNSFTFPDRPQERSTSTDPKRISVYSDDSDINPLGILGRAAAHAHSVSQTRSTITVTEQSKDITPEVQAANEIQATLDERFPSTPDSLDDLADAARAAITDLLDVAVVRTNVNLIKDAIKRTTDAVRNLIYASSTLIAPMTSLPHPYTSNTGFSDNAELKVFHRKVAAAMVKFISGIRSSLASEFINDDIPLRFENDAVELERAIATFIEIVLSRRTPENAARRVRAVFRSGAARRGIGLDLLGASSAGSWKGFGFVEPMTGQRLGSDTLMIVNQHKTNVHNTLVLLQSSILAGQTAADVTRIGRQSLRYLVEFLGFVTDINIARALDFDSTTMDASYTQSVKRAKELVRALENTVQAAFDDGAVLFNVIQSAGATTVLSATDARPWSFLNSIIPPLLKNLDDVCSNVSELVQTAQSQVDACAQAGVDAFIGRRDAARYGAVGYSTTERDAVVYSPPMESETSYMSDAPNPDEDTVQLSDVMSCGTERNPRDATPYSANGRSRAYSSATENGRGGQTDMSDAEVSKGTPPTPPPAMSSSTQLTLEQIADDEKFLDEVEDRPLKVPKRSHKIKLLLGPDVPDEIIEKVDPDSKPWFLRAEYGAQDIWLTPEGNVRGGTLPALIERLTSHDNRDIGFNSTFLVTFKSFTTLDEVFQSLVKRFYIQPPESLTPEEVKIWTEQKQQFVRFRVINILKQIVTDDNVLEKEDMYILERIKEFAAKVDKEIVPPIPAVKQLLIHVEHAQAGGDSLVKMTHLLASSPPAPIMPKVGKVMKLLDIEPLELARQLTIMESRLFAKIRPMECLNRGRGDVRPADCEDNVSAIIDTSNKVAEWVADTVLSKEDSRKRAVIVKQFIAVADRCRLLQNFSTMAALVAGLNSPPIRRLKRTWEQVNARNKAQLQEAEKTMDTNKNFTNYRAILKSAQLPCVPFFGVYLSVLTFIQDGNKNMIQGDIINFSKREKFAEVVREIKHYQSKPYNFTVLPAIQTFIDESLAALGNTPDLSDRAWNLSLEREPRERDDEKMARLLQESGFL